jgi:hypothetical protein
LNIHCNITNFPLLKSSQIIQPGPSRSTCSHVLNWYSSLNSQTCKSQARLQFAVEEDGLQTWRVPGNILRTADKGRLYRSVARQAARNPSRKKSELATQHTDWSKGGRTAPPPPPDPPTPLTVPRSGGRNTNLVSRIRISGIWLHFPIRLRDVVLSRTAVLTLPISHRSK